MSNITFKYKNEEYCLEFTAETAARLEAAGFVIDEIKTKPNIMVPLLVHHSFNANHRKVSYETIEAIFRQIPNKDEFISALAISYSETVKALFDDPVEETGNIEWVENK